MHLYVCVCFGNYCTKPRAPPSPRMKLANILGPATPRSFREQCYLDRERGEKKKVDEKWSRKFIGQRLSGSSVVAAANAHRAAPQLDHMEVTPVSVRGTASVTASV